MGLSQYLVLFNNPIDRQVATLARRIYPSTCATFMRKFEDATARPYGYLVLDLKSSTSEQDKLTYYLEADSIRQAIKLRKDLFMDVWPNHNIETEKASKDQDDSTMS